MQLPITQQQTSIVHLLVVLRTYLKISAVQVYLSSSLLHLIALEWLKYTHNYVKMPIVWSNQSCSQSVMSQVKITCNMSDVNQMRISILDPYIHF